jgi:hypothetical protein
VSCTPSLCLVLYSKSIRCTSIYTRPRGSIIHPSYSAIPLFLYPSTGSMCCCRRVGAAPECTGELARWDCPPSRSRQGIWETWLLCAGGCPSWRLQRRGPRWRDEQQIRSLLRRRSRIRALHRPVLGERWRMWLIAGRCCGQGQHEGVGRRGLGTSG